MTGDPPGAPRSGTAALLAAARDWLADDPDPDTRAELAGLVDDAGSPDPGRSGPALASLADRFSGTLQFGTAGLRGELGAGPNRMNRVVVARAAAGLVAFLRERGGTGLVVGHDARHGSAAFARDTAEIAAGAGLRAVLLPRALPTPVLAGAVRRLGVDAGVMVTASHNPAPDNGYKVYLGDGRQLNAPDDAAVAAHIARVGRVGDLPRDPAGVEVPDVDGPGGLLTAYVHRVAGLVGASGPGRAGLRVVQTSVHGVGGPVVAAVAAAAGFDPLVTVASQTEPDPDFPTTPFPNPEEPGVLDPALALAAGTGAHLVVAQDPDADRCAVAVPDPDGDGDGDGGWRRLTGDEVGVLLAARLLDPALGGGSTALAGVDPGRTAFARTIVSSTWLDAVAAAHGVPVQLTLTGFKWLARVPGLRYAYEEALGYCVDPDAVADKDGISAALVVMDLAARLRAAGRTVSGLLDDLARAHGVFLTGQLSLRVAELSERDVQLGRLREHCPDTLGGLAVTRVEDLAEPSDGLPPTPGLRLTLAGSGGTGPAAGLAGWVVVRPSGTERKTKSYLEVSGPAGDDLPAARAAATAALAAVTDDLRAVLTGSG